jgi:hypothetical protein
MTGSGIAEGFPTTGELGQRRNQGMERLYREVVEQGEVPTPPALPAEHHEPEGGAQQRQPGDAGQSGGDEQGIHDRP